ncbi:helix-turn-helix transcriptional regulator [Bacillus sp. REN3]|uniref:helix-turn-helix domain-containing protein n=1 Tax=Bacillus sp. REN3 TaxID=2802440 RepID=UPI001AEDA26A|nr:helix-turn-helix transcriptional regulator [Bacillus sp. REN3]
MLREKSNPFALFLYNARLQRDWSLREVGSITGLEPSYINRLERGERTNPSVSTIHALASAYEVDLLNLIELVMRVLEEKKENEK